MPYYKIPNKKFGQNANKKGIGQNAIKKENWTKCQIRSLDKMSTSREVDKTS